MRPDNYQQLDNISRETLLSSITKGRRHATIKIQQFVPKDKKIISAFHGIYYQDGMKVVSDGRMLVAVPNEDPNMKPCFITSEGMVEEKQLPLELAIHNVIGYGTPKRLDVSSLSGQLTVLKSLQKVLSPLHDIQVTEWMVNLTDDTCLFSQQVAESIQSLVKMTKSPIIVDYEKGVLVQDEGVFALFMKMAPEPDDPRLNIIVQREGDFAIRGRRGLEFNQSSIRHIQHKIDNAEDKDRAQLQQKLDAMLAWNNLMQTSDNLTSENIRFRMSDSAIAEKAELFQDELQFIIDTAKANETYLKAPNGKPSNLPEDQWALVRTHAFKSWFGEWDKPTENGSSLSSQVIDENGEPLVVFHGTTNDNVTRTWNPKNHTYDTSHEPFTVFERNPDGIRNTGHFFSSYQQNAFDYGYNTYDVFLNLRNPLVIDAQGSSYVAITHNGEERDTYGWAAFAETSGYDGVIFRNVIDGVGYGAMQTPGTDYVAFGANQIKSATANIGTFSPDNDDIRFRKIPKPQEESASLIAVHNTTEEQLKKLLELGGFPMPSIAITHAGMGHSEFGDISLLFDRNSIDPANRQNKVYSGDAWTPTFPSVGYKLNEDKTSDIYSRANKVKNLPLFNPKTFHPDNYERNANGLDTGGLVEHFKDNYGAKQFYLAENGNAVTEYEQHEVEKYPADKIPIYEDVLQRIGIERIVNGNIDSVRDEVRQILEQHGIGLSQMKPNVVLARVNNTIKAALDYAENGNKKTEIDVDATKQKIDERIDQQRFEGWLNELFNGVVEKKGIRNDQGIFTPSGNSRKWEELYDEVTLDNIVKAMQRQTARGGQGLFGRSIFGAAQKEYPSIDEIRKEAKKVIKNITNDEFEAQKNAITDRLSDVKIPGVGSSFSDTMDMEENIKDAVAQSHTAKGIYRYLKEFYSGMTMEAAEEIAGIVRDIQQMSSRYFESKPQRAVGFDEVRLAVVPVNTDAELIRQLERQGIPVRTYERGNEEQRREIVANATEELDIRFRTKYHFTGHEIERDFDNIDEANMCSQNLAMARLMERQMGGEEKSRQVIKMATGWERNESGKWAYYPDVFDLDSLDGVDHRKRYLDDFVKDNKLFEAYPQLRGVQIDFVKRDNLPSCSYSGSDTKVIQINTSDPTVNKQQALVHGIQFAIQDIEGFGFTNGKNKEAIKLNTGSTIDAERVPTLEMMWKAASSMWVDINRWDLQLMFEAQSIFELQNASLDPHADMRVLRDYGWGVHIVEHNDGTYKFVENNNSTQEIDIPNFTEAKYFLWDEPVADIDKDNIAVQLSAVHEHEIATIWNKLNDAPTGKDVYRIIRDYLGRKYASRLLYQVGFTGVLHLETNQAGEIRRNYVIFNADDVTVKDQIKLHQPQNLGESTKEAEEVRRKEEAAADMAKKLGVCVRMVRDVSDIHPLEEQALNKCLSTGWYDKAKNEIAVVLPNCKDVAEVQKVFLHEAVAHYGIPKLIGKNNAEQLYRKIFFALPHDEQLKLWDKYHDTAIAGEEYIAQVAETGRQNTTLSKIIATIREFFRTVLHINLKMNDTDLLHIIEASQRNLEQIQQSRFQKQEQYNGPGPKIEKNLKNQITL